MSKSKAVSILGVALDILQTLLALIVVITTSWKLTNVDLTDIGLNGPKINTKCLFDGSNLEGPLTGTGFCAYAIAVGIISLLVNLVFSCIGKLCKCVTLNACFASKVVATVGDVILTVWWAVAFTLFVRRGTAANELGWPQRAARDGVIAAAFAAMLAFAADVVVSVIVIASS